MTARRERHPAASRATAQAERPAERSQRRLEPRPPSPATAVLRLTDVVKTFPGVRALDGVQLEVRAGEVHCLLGQNGAGKSTLIKVLAGVHHADEGNITWLGEPFAPANPQAAMKAGIATIYQELDLVDDLSVAENAFLGHEDEPLRLRPARHARPGVPGRSWPGSATREIPPRRLVRSLPAAGKQIVSMARALSHDARLIVMDEPSAVLAHDEVDNLFRIIRELTAHGIAVIYISHRLEEIREIGDRVTVLKDGRTTAANLPARTTPTRELVSRMTGRSIEYVFPPRVDQRPRPSPLLVVEGLTRAGRVRRRLADRRAPARSSASPGWSARAAPSCWRPSSARAGRTAARSPWTASGSRSVGGAVTAGIGMAPEERKSQALLLDEPIYRNMTLAVVLRVRPRRLHRHRRRERRPPREDRRLAGAAPARRAPAGPHAVRRQPAEGRGRPLAARRHQAAAARRADPRRRRRRPGRALPGDPRTGRERRRVCCWSPARCPRCSAWPTGCW